MADTFCILPFTQLQIRPGGEVKMCCVDAGWNDHASVYRDSLDTIWSSDRLRGVRRAMADGQPVADCQACHASEQAGGHSMRLSSNGFFDAREGLVGRERLLTRVRERDFAVPEAPSQLLLEVGNVCNLKCRMCNGSSSSAIQSDRVHAAWAGSAPTPIPPQARVPGPWHRQPAFLTDELLAHADELRVIHLIGGETLMSKGGLTILRELVRRGDAGHITIVLNTNGTFIDDEWLDLLGRFARSTLSVSIDGVGPVNDYIRYPSRFETVLASLPRFRAVPRADVMVTSTFQAYNALGFADVLQLCDELDLPIYVFALIAPVQLRVDALPPRARALAAERLRAYFARRRSGVVQDGAAELVHTLEAGGQSWDHEQARTFMTFTNDLDRDRGQRLAALQPELMELFADAGLPWETTTRHLGASRRRKPAPEPAPAPQPAPAPVRPLPRTLRAKLATVAARLATLATTRSPSERRVLASELAASARRFVRRRFR